jgi:hypothetical protein
MKLTRLLLQILLLALVIFFGYHYFTRPELYACLSVPLANLSRQTKDVPLEREKIENFILQFTHELSAVASRSSQFLTDLQSAPATASGQLSDQLLNKGEYLYCKSIIDKIEQQK